MKSTQAELKQTYQLVSQDLVHHLAHIKEGDKILLPKLGTFVKTKQKIKDWDQQKHVYWRISFRASANLKRELDK